METTPGRAPQQAMPETSSKRGSRARRIALVLAGALSIYLIVAYVLVPRLWSRYAHHHPALDDIPGITYTAAGIPGDPLNVALIGTQEEVQKIMAAAQWHPADPLGLRSDVKIAADTVLERPDVEAPVSSLYLFGRKEDLAFEQPVGDNPRQRHHVRFWRGDKLDASGRPAWVGSVTYDERVGFSHTTGQVTHHVDADVDAERDRLFSELKQTGDLVTTYPMDDFHKVRSGRNGGGDPWTTDGRLLVGEIEPEKTP